MIWWKPLKKHGGWLRKAGRRQACQPTGWENPTNCALSLRWVVARLPESVVGFRGRGSTRAPWPLQQGENTSSVTLWGVQRSDRRWWLLFKCRVLCSQRSRLERRRAVAMSCLVWETVVCTKEEVKIEVSSRLGMGDDFVGKECLSRDIFCNWVSRKCSSAEDVCPQWLETCAACSEKCSHQWARLWRRCQQNQKRTWNEADFVC